MRNQTKGKGIVLKKVAYGEADLILTLIMESGDRRSLLARGARKSQKRFSGGILDPTSYVQIGFSEGSGLSTLTEAHQIESFDGLRKTYEKLETALSFVSLIDKLCQEGDVGSSELFNIFGNALKAVQIVRDLQKLDLQFKIKILNQQGSLSFESWMDPYLRRPLRESDLIEDSSELSGKSLAIRERIHDYLTGVIGLRESQLSRTTKSPFGGRH